MTFDSITNRGEYFSDHYLDTMLQAGLKKLRTRWDDAEGKGDATPRTRLRGMSRAFGAERARAAVMGSMLYVAAIWSAQNSMLLAFSLSCSRVSSMPA